MRQWFIHSCWFACFAMCASGSTFAVNNLLSNPGFDDLDMDGFLGDDWLNFGATGFNDFFGGNPHASLFADDALNDGAIYPFFDVPVGGGGDYQFDLMDTRIEANWDARFQLSLEYFANNGITKLGETFETLNAAARLALPNVDAGGAANGSVFSLRGTAPSGTAFIRPTIRFDMVNSTYVSGVTMQANAFVFDTFLSEAPGLGDQALKNPDFEDLNGDGFLGDNWRSYGAAGFNDFFGGDPHASLFADLPGNFGGIYQQSILGTPGASYGFRLDNVRIEANVAADFQFGLEYFGDDDYNKLGETLVVLDTSVTGDGLSFSMVGTAVAGTKYVRPIVKFDNVTSTATSQENVFVFAASLFEITANSTPDFNRDGQLDCLDVDALVADIAASTNTPGFDLTGDNTVDQQDLNRWLALAGTVNLASGNPYLLGDANLDGSVDGSDFGIWNSHKFTAVAAWCSGDFNADGSVDGSDFGLWNGNKFQSADGRSVVPEPLSCGLAALACMFALRVRSQSRCGKSVRS